MALNEDTLKRAARRSYEWGRLRSALQACWFLVPMVVLSYALAGQPAVSLLTGALLLVATAALGWRGEAYGTAVVPGLVAGTVPLSLPILAGQAGHLCIGGACSSLCGPACLLSGIVAGAMLGTRCVRLDAGRHVFLPSGVIVAGLAGVLGCALGGVAGVLGLAAGVLIGTLPPALVAQFRRG